MAQNDTEKRLKLMRFWLIGIFIIVFAGTSIFSGYIGSIIGSPIGGMLVSWPIWLVTAVLALAVYFGYKYWIGRK